MRIAAHAALLFSLAGPALAGDFSLDLPIDCAIGEDQPCHIQNYMDRDPGPEFADFACQKLGYDGHKGTDFSLKFFSDLDRNVAVLAAAPGRIIGLRDGMADVLYTSENAAQLEGRDCGNGVVVDHGDGWQTQYCHLKNGSVSVRTGDTVSAGDPLGAVGLSGRTQFPHLHLSLRKNGTPVDPFDPNATQACSTEPRSDTLWSNPPTYQSGGVMAAGFSGGVPDYGAIKAGRAHEPILTFNSPALVLWGFAFGSRPGDILRLTITGPSGAQVFQTDTELTKHQARYFRAGGRKTASAAWFVTGTYKGNVELIRGGQVISDTSTAVTITQ